MLSSLACLFANFKEILNICYQLLPLHALWLQPGAPSPPPRALWLQPGHYEGAVTAAMATKHAKKPVFESAFRLFKDHELHGLIKSRICR